MAYTVASVMSSSKGPRPKLTDYLLRWRQSAEERRQTGAEQLAIFKGLAARMSKGKEPRVDHR